MKQLTTAEKAKAYDEAIERAKKWRNAPNADKIPTYANRVIDEIFPEIVESENERIKSEIIEYIKTGTYHKDWLDWLERQGEPLNESVYDTEDKEMYQAIAIGLTDMLDEYGWSDFGGIPINNILNWLERQGEEPIGIRSRHTTGKLAEIIKDIESADKIEALRTEYEKGRADAIAEMQVAWSEEDKAMLKETLAIIETVEDINKAEDGFLGVKMWLKSLKQRIGG